MAQILNLTNLFMSSSYSGLIQYSSSGEIFDGLGNQIVSLNMPSVTGSLIGSLPMTTKIKTKRFYWSGSVINTNFYGETLGNFSTNTYAGIRSIYFHNINFYLNFTNVVASYPWYSILSIDGGEAAPGWIVYDAAHPEVSDLILTGSSWTNCISASIWTAPPILQTIVAAYGSVPISLNVSTNTGSFTMSGSFEVFVEYLETDTL